MRATLNIPDELVAQVQRLSGKKTKTEAIVVAMQEFVRQRAIKKLLAMKGKLEIEDVSEELENLELKEAEEDAARWRNS